MKIFALFVAIALLPIAAVAASRLDAPATVTFKWGVTNLRRISPFSPRGHISVTKNTCYSKPAAEHDILRETYFAAYDEKSGGGLAIDVYAKNLGTCTFAFVDKGGDTATTTVTVSR
jgi:hypothetical protein